MPIKRLDHVNFITHDMPKTIEFYRIIGLVHGEHLSIDTAQSVYFYIPDSDIAILHIGNAKVAKKQPKFERLAELKMNQDSRFSTGAFDHFCLALDYEDYTLYVGKLDKEDIPYQTYCHEDIPLKQLWLLDPNGVRVELNFIK